MISFFIDFSFSSRLKTCFYHSFPLCFSLHEEEMEECYYLIMPFGSKGQPGPGIGEGDGGGRGGVEFEEL